MADAIRCACDTLNSAAGQLARLRISEIRQSLDFLGVQHTEVLLGLLVVVLLQFTKFAAILLLAIVLAYSIFYLWENYFPGIAELGYRGKKMCRNVRTYVNLPPFTYSDGEESTGTGEYIVNPSRRYTGDLLTEPARMLVPMLQDSNKMFQSANLQVGSPLLGMETGFRGSRGPESQKETLEAGKHRREHRHYWRPTNTDKEREREHHSSRRSAQGASHEAKRTPNVLRIPKITSGAVDIRRLPTITSEDLKRLPNITSGESRKTHKEESRRLPTITSAELGYRRVPKITSHTNDSPRWLNMAAGATESRRRSKSSRPQEGGESRRPDRVHGAGEAKYRRSPERPYPAQGRRVDEQRQQPHRVIASSDDNRPTKNRRSLNNNTRSGVIRRQYPDDHYERLRMENRDFQARRLGASSGHPTSEGAMLTQQENFVASFKRNDRREPHRNIKSSNPPKEGSNKNRRDRKTSPSPSIK
ncbi:uncharacterized protein [Drosophila kikkawai]|uniref:Serine/arginine repetitive matrix protein 2 n=1 Tax=Drosophila kikkawai TaxID=30033 RepID=A0A6P4JTW0_DROKI|nr:uncharacterized protein LOC108085852 [Drosophila kikkawai]